MQKELVLQFPRKIFFSLTNFLQSLKNIMAILCQKVTFPFCSHSLHLNYRPNSAQIDSAVRGDQLVEIVDCPSGGKGGLCPMRRI